jgi:hypothetical protein
MKKIYNTITALALSLAQGANVQNEPIKMFIKKSSPIYDPKRPHPIQSYRSQQRAAKKRKK